MDYEGLIDDVWHIYERVVGSREAMLGPQREAFLDFAAEACNFYFDLTDGWR